MRPLDPERDLGWRVRKDRRTSAERQVAADILRGRIQLRPADAADPIDRWKWREAHRARRQHEIDEAQRAEEARLKKIENYRRWAAAKEAEPIADIAAAKARAEQKKKQQWQDSRLADAYHKEVAEQNERRKQYLLRLEEEGVFPLGFGRSEARVVVDLLWEEAAGRGVAEDRVPAGLIGRLREARRKMANGYQIYCGIVLPNGIRERSDI